MRVAITGGIGEGKSTVLGYLRDLGHDVSSADEIARRVFLEPSTNSELASLVGIAGSLAPERLRAALSEDPRLRRRINAVMHPRIVALMKAEPAQFVEVPLLIEACLQGLFDRVWVVACGREEQLRRLVARYGDLPKAEAMASTQLRTESKSAFSDRVIRTNGEPETVRRIVSEAVNALLGGPI